jgi:hypothetical protein
MPQSWIKRSARVDFPWSMWAMMLKFRMFSMDEPGRSCFFGLAAVVLYQNHGDGREKYPDPTEEAIYHKKIALQRQF